MDFQLHEEGAIIDAVHSLGCDIFDYEDVHKLMLSTNLEKPVSSRFIAWLINLKVVPVRRQEWGKSIYEKVDKYYQHCRHYFSKKPKDPLATINFDIEEALRADMEKSNVWFKDIMKQIDIPAKYLDDPFLRVSRIYSVLSNEMRDFSYTQGLDKIGYVCLAFTSKFAHLGKLSADFAEAVAYYLTGQILSIIPARHLINNHQALVEYFEEEDQVLRTVSPDHFEALQKHKSSSLYYGLRFEMCLFANQHNILEIFLLWDQIIARFEQLTEFVQCLSIAHVMQIQLPPTYQNIAEEFASYKRWDTQKIIIDATKILTHTRTLKQSCCLYFCPKLKQYHGYEIKPKFFV